MCDFSRIRLLVMDVDGTLTDGKIYIGVNGEMLKAFDVHDGYAIANMLPEMGVIPVVITGRRSSIVECRCEELGVTELYQGVSDKLECLRRIVVEHGYDLSEVAYVGDDNNDLNVIEAVRHAGGMTACPFDATNEVRECVAHILQSEGGQGALREFVELISTNTLKK